MNTLRQHQVEIQRNLRAWESKPLLREIYHLFYLRIERLLDPDLPGRMVELGAGLGGLKSQLPQVLRTDLFPHPWLDLVCDGYELPFRSGAVSYLILFDVFHHLEWPGAFMAEARRVLTPGGRLILLEPYVSWISFFVYGMFHHEPLGCLKSVSHHQTAPRQRRYYAAQGNATRLFFGPDSSWLKDWRVFHKEAFASFSYLLSGGFSKPALYPARWLPALGKLDEKLSRWPKIFGARCLLGLEIRGRTSANAGSGTSMAVPFCFCAVTYRLQETSDFVNWLDVMNSPVVVGAEYQLNVTPSPSNRFYRLSYP